MACAVKSRRKIPPLVAHPMHLIMYELQMFKLKERSATMASGSGKGNGLDDEQGAALARGATGKSFTERVLLEGHVNRSDSLYRSTKVASRR